MDIVYDPSERKSFASAVQVNLEAHLLLSSSLTSQLDPSYAERIAQADPHCSVLDVHRARDMRLRTLTDYCLGAVMADGAGRSLYHLAGEVCRIAAELRAVSVEQGDDQTFRFGEDDSLKQARFGNWRPQGTALKVPTITGQSPRKPDYLRWGYLGNKPITSIHRQWLHMISYVLEESAKSGYGIRRVTKLEPPFELSSGRIIFDTKVPFYRAEEAGGGRKNLPPFVRTPSGCDPTCVPTPA